MFNTRRLMGKVTMQMKTQRIKSDRICDVHHDVCVCVGVCVCVTYVSVVCNVV